MKNIIVATDFSTVALNAVHYANKLAKDIKADLILLNAYQIPISYTEVPLVSISLDEIRKISEDGLDELKKNLLKQNDVKINIHCFSFLGDVVDGIKEISKEFDAGLIITGSKGVTGFERFMIGSNSMRIIEKNNIPLMTIPPGVLYRKINNIGLATDFDDVTNTIDTKIIKSFVEMFDAKLFVANIDYKKKHFTNETPNEIRKLSEFIKPIQPTFLFIENQRIDDGINSFVEKQNIDLLIMMPRIHTLIEKMLEKSHTREMIKQTHIPILHITKKTKNLHS